MILFICFSPDAYSKVVLFREADFILKIKYYREAPGQIRFLNIFVNNTSINSREKVLFHGQASNWISAMRVQIKKDEVLKILICTLKLCLRVFLRGLESQQI